MGWTIPNDTPTRRDLIAERVKPQDCTFENGLRVRTVPLRHCYIGGRFSGTLFIVWERTKTYPDGKTDTERFIEVDSLRYYPQGRGMGNWGYKDMDCCMGPREALCPPAYLDLCPPHIREGKPEEDQRCKHFHERSRAYWAKRREYMKKRRALKVGDTVSLVLGCQSKTVTIESLRPLIGRGEDGLHYRIPARMLALA